MKKTTFLKVLKLHLKIIVFDVETTANTPIFYKQLYPNRDSRVDYVFCYFRLSSCLIYNGLLIFGVA